jgi:zinc finger protein ZFPM1
MVLPSEDGSSPHQCAAAAAVSPPVTSLLSSSGWRCPCCSAHLPTATAAQKHLEENHAGMLKGFRCTICSYRGNTLRGMRTHIRMHLLQAGADNKTCAEVKEEDFITCVLQTEPDREAVAADEAEAAARLTVLRDEAAQSPPEALVVKLEPCEDKISFTEEDEDSLRHCKACDISFQERDIYLSHKKFYCKAAARRMTSVSPSAVKTPPTRPEASART